MEEETKWKGLWILGLEGKRERRKLNEELIVKVGGKELRWMEA